MATDREGAKAGRMQFSWWIRVDLGERLVDYAERSNTFQREVVEAALEDYLEANDRPDNQPKGTA
jgi:hypothetical protein